MKTRLKVKQSKSRLANYELQRARLFKVKMAQETKLLKKIKKKLGKLEEALRFVGYSEDLVYRFYHQSFKVYRIQELTERIVAQLDEQKRTLNAQLLESTNAVEALRLHNEVSAVAVQLAEAEERWCRLQEAIEGAA